MIEIERLDLRIAGIEPDEAGRLGQDVARRLAELAAAGKLPGGSRSLGAIEVRLGPLAGAGRAELVERIVQAVAAALRQKERGRDA